MEDDRDIRIKQMKEDAKLQRRRMYLQRKEFLKNCPKHQEKIQLQKAYLKEARAAQKKKRKEMAPSKPWRVQDREEGLVAEKRSAEPKNPFELLMQTGSNSTLRPLGEIIEVDFSSKKKKI
jgi:hypothetical protein